MSIGTPQSSQRGQPCSLPESAGLQETAPHTLAPCSSRRPAPRPCPGAGDHPQQPQRATRRPSSPLAASQSSCHELLSSTCPGGSKITLIKRAQAGQCRLPIVLPRGRGRTRPPTIVTTALSAITEGCLAQREEVSPLCLLPEHGLEVINIFCSYCERDLSFPLFFSSVVTVGNSKAIDFCTFVS